MPDDDQLIDRFENARPRLGSIAYRMLGSRSEADDAVQEAWLRLDGAEARAIENLDGWLTTVTTRICLDRLRSRRARREDATGLHLVDDVADEGRGADPAEEALIGDSVGAALMVVMEGLPPAERVAFVLHDVFAVSFDEIAEVLDRSTDASRQLASRARRRVRGAASGADLDLVRRRELVRSFRHAARSGDLAGLLAILAPDVELRPDAAALRMGALSEMRGADAVANALSGGARDARLAVVDGFAAMVWAPGDTVRGVIEFTIDDDRIVAIDVTGDENRIGALEIVLLD